MSDPSKIIRNSVIGATIGVVAGAIFNTVLGVSTLLIAIGITGIVLASAEIGVEVLFAGFGAALATAATLKAVRA